MKDIADPHFPHFLTASKCLRISKTGNLFLEPSSSKTEDEMGLVPGITGAAGDWDPVAAVQRGAKRL